MRGTHHSLSPFLFSFSTFLTKAMDRLRRHLTSHLSPCFAGAPREHMGQVVKIFGHQQVPSSILCMFFLLNKILQIKNHLRSLRTKSGNPRSMDFAGVPGLSSARSCALTTPYELLELLGDCTRKKE